jgi:hypothetical protein
LGEYTLTAEAPGFVPLIIESQHVTARLQLTVYGGDPEPIAIAIGKVTGRMVGRSLIRVKIVPIMHGPIAMETIFRRMDRLRLSA